MKRWLYRQHLWLRWKAVKHVARGKPTLYGCHLVRFSNGCARFHPDSRDVLVCGNRVEDEAA